MKAAETTSIYPLELSRGIKGCPEASERLQDASEGPLGDSADDSFHKLNRFGSTGVHEGCRNSFELPTEALKRQQGVLSIMNMMLLLMLLLLVLLLLMMMTLLVMKMIMMMIGRCR